MATAGPVGQKLIEHASDTFESGEVRSGSALLWGAHKTGDGVNFAIFSRHATHVRLEFFDAPGDAAPSRSIDLDPENHRTGDVWHVWVQGVASGQLYGYRVDGPYDPQNGHRYNRHKLLLDPFATAVTAIANWEFGPARGFQPANPMADLSFSPLDDAAAMPKCVFTHEHFNWEGDRPPRHSASKTVIYETHVRGCTIDRSSGVAHPGTYAGLVEKIPYFRDLGVTAIELMPVQEFNENEIPRKSSLTGERLKNYWGYNPVAFFAPKGSYSSVGARGQQKVEFKEMVKAFHRAGIELIVDIVMNHTGEANELGPTICFRGIENPIFYLLNESDMRHYKDYTGAGNTLNANHPIVQDYVMAVLRCWAMEMHVDGFRFDLASVLGRDEHGSILANAPLLERIAEDAILRDVKLIAEAWDAGGAYQVGSFSECRWAEWNGQFRDDVRRFWLGDPGMMGSFASRVCGSADLYERSGKGPESSVNFVTSHDGFTLNDLVSYRQKHNQENGEDNHDGTNANYSENCGIEGPTDDPGIEALRKRLMKNFLLTLFVSRGVPMLLGGDEFRRTQHGNNNAYCQDNAVSWYDWRFLEKNQEMYRFTKGAIAFRNAHPALCKEAFYTDQDINWFGPQGSSPNWLDPQQKSLACLISERQDPDLFMIFNASTDAQEFSIPSAAQGKLWHLAIDTFGTEPEDWAEGERQHPLKDQKKYRIEARSSAILVA